jgi:hypothetical protein
LGVREGETAAIGGGRRREAAASFGARRACTGRAGEREKTAAEHPHHLGMLRGRSIIGGRQRDGGAAAARGASSKGGGGGHGC